MTEEKKRVLTPRERGQLGGLATARRQGSEGMAALGAKGAAAAFEKYGREQLIRANHARWGKLPKKADR